MLLNRLDKQGQSGSGHPNLAEAPSVTAKKFYYDTVCYGSKAAFTCALEAFGADHLVTGSDYPVLQDYEAYKETFAYIERPRQTMFMLTPTQPNWSKPRSISFSAASICGNGSMT